MSGGIFLPSLNNVDLPDHNVDLSENYFDLSDIKLTSISILIYKHNVNEQ